VRNLRASSCVEWWYCSVNKPTVEKTPRISATFAERIGVAATRKINAQRSPNQGVWFGLGMIGLIGWSVVVPTLLGAGLGNWLDRHHAGRHPWTLALMVGGLCLGCLNAWHWVSQEDKAMHDGESSDDP
jgi:ATP synthase protein I